MITGLNIADLKIDPNRLSVKLNQAIDYDDRVTDNEKETLYLACDRIVESLSGGETMRSLLGDEARFKVAVDTVCDGGEGEKNTDREKLTAILRKVFRYSVTRHLEDVVQTDTDNDTYERLVAEAKEANTDIDLYVFDTIYAIAQTFVPEDAEKEPDR